MRRLGLVTGTALVVSSMIGAGIFTTTGILAADLPDARAIHTVWALGGALALAAALCFGELGARMPGPGAEVHYLHRTFGPWTGFVAGLVTLLAGFCVPIAAVAHSLGEHLEEPLAVDPRLIGTAAIVFMSAVHARGTQAGARFNDAACAFKVALVAAFVVSGFLAAPTAAPPPPDGGSAGTAAYAHGLVLVAFAYTGWNAAAYIGGELRDPERVLPRSLLLGCAIVTVAYLLLNAVFLRAASPHEMAGEVAVGRLAAIRLFGPAAGEWFSLGIAVLLASTLSSFHMTGPRVIVSMAEDGELPRSLASRNERDAPARASWLVGALSLGFLWSASFRWLLEYVGFLLTLSAALAVSGLMVLRSRDPAFRPRFRVPLYPVLPLVFVAGSLWVVVDGARDGAAAAVGAGATLLVAAALRPLLRTRSP